MFVFIVTGPVPNREQAFLRLYELRVLSYEAARECYYRGRREERFEPVLMEFAKLRRIISEEEASRVFQTIERVQPCTRSIRRWRDPRLDMVELVVGAGSRREPAESGTFEADE